MNEREFTVNDIVYVLNLDSYNVSFQMSGVIVRSINLSKSRPTRIVWNIENQEDIIWLRKIVT